MDDTETSPRGRVVPVPVGGGAESSGAFSRLLLWTAFVVYCTVAMADLLLWDQTLPLVGRITYFEVLLLGAALLGSGTLMRVAGDPQHSRGRTMCRILITYLLFDLLVVIPVSIWLGAATVVGILLHTVVRFTWLLFPVVLALCADDRARRIAAAVAAIAAVCLVVWGVYSAATGGGGYYLDDGNVRWRVLSLGGGGLLLCAWPLVLALSGAVPRRYTAALFSVSIVGLVLTNSRSGLVAFAIAGFACVVMSGQTRRLVPWILPVGLTATVLALVWGQNATGAFGYTLSHLFDYSSGGGADRLMRWRLAWDFFASHPLNDYVWSWRYYLVHVDGLYEPHNFVLYVAVYEGIVGLLFYGSVLTSSLRGTWSWGRKDAEARALIGYLIAYLVFSLANANWYQAPSIALFIAASAALVARVDQLRRADASRLPEEVFE